jgi:hypothetical protein
VALKFDLAGHRPAKPATYASTSATLPFWNNFVIP